MVCNIRYKLILAGYEISKDRFHDMLAVLRSVNDEGTDYLCNIPFEQWTKHTTAAYDMVI